MKIFELDKNYKIVCEFESTRYGFRHVAHLIRNNIEVAKTKICYYNRTWERFEFESVLLLMVDKYFSDLNGDKQAYSKIIENINPFTGIQKVK